MKANELMIEDWVDLSEVPNETIPCRVVFLHADELFVIQPNDKACDIVGYDMVTPLTLTEEILKKNGFRLHSQCGYEYIENPDGLFSFRFCVGGLFQKKFTANINGRLVVLNYVHELQHALRLCGLNDLADNLKM